MCILGWERASWQRTSTHHSNIVCLYPVSLHGPIADLFLVLVYNAVIQVSLVLYELCDNADIDIASTRAPWLLEHG